MKTLIVIVVLFLASSLSAEVRTFFIGDYGENTPAELAVRNTMFSFFDGNGYDTVITLGDNNYPIGGANTIMENIGKCYSVLMYPFNEAGFGNPNNYRGNPLRINYFFPCMGNHDWYSSIDYAYLLFLRDNIPSSSSGNDRYYNFKQGFVEFFIYDSWLGDSYESYVRPEPSGFDINSAQAQWLRQALANSTATWKIVILHHPPYCSTLSTMSVRLPFRQWGANLVMAGHDHLYEHLFIDSLNYTINGLGGGAKDPNLPVPMPGSVKLYNQYYGFQMMTAYPDSLNMKFINIGSTIVDNFTIRKGVYNPPPNPNDTLRNISDSVKTLWKRVFNN